MLFNSWQFALFFTIVLIAYYLIPKGKRWMMLLAASYYFYMSWNPALITLMLASTAVHYVCALYIGGKGRNKRGTRKLVMIAGISFSLAILFLFKYFDFFSASAGYVAGLFGARYEPLLLNLTLPMGISFYTFQTFSYTIDVYRREVEPERNFFRLSLFVSYFPQLVAGPIERYDRLNPQLVEEHDFDYDNVASGFIRIAIGLFKKIVVADTMAKGVDLVYQNLSDYTGLTLIVATVMFAFQIYCDFSGYSDIAMGCARCMGIKLMHNFRSPYLSRSIREFWSRWHISLSTWFRDYVYIPIGGSRAGKFRSAANLVATFLLSGLWHGANWTFVIWGALHAAYQIVEKALFGKRPKLDKRPWYKAVVPVCVTFILVTAAWVFFRAENLSDAAYVFRNMFSGISNPAGYITTLFASMKISTVGGVMILCEIAMLFVIDAVGYRHDTVQAVRSLKWYLRWPIYALFVCVVVVMSTKSTVNEFIYFQF
ncbi:MAG: MBOAT family O-acyltransferase [Clostridia bacterium]|nr:MBOAT family O-acyltransferase [Clostridia bacterium]